MIIKWIQSLTQGSQIDGVNAAKKADEDERKKRKETKLVDTAHEAMNERAAQDSEDLQGLVQIGWPNVQQEKFRGKVRQKVWDVVREGFGGATDKKMVDEITERIVASAEADKYYKDLFEDA